MPKGKTTGTTGFLEYQRKGVLQLRSSNGSGDAPPPQNPQEMLSKPRDEILERSQENKPVRKWPKKALIKGKKTRLAILTIPEEVLDTGDPSYTRALRGANDYRKHRNRELVIAHGYVSAGVNSLLTSAALALASSRYLYEKSAESADLALLQQAVKLSAEARQNELAAWELCAREAVARKKAAAAINEVPWYQSKQEDKPKRRPGRPRKTPIIENEVIEVDNALDGTTQASGGQVDQPRAVRSEPDLCGPEVSPDAPDGGYTGGQSGLYTGPKQNY